MNVFSPDEGRGVAGDRTQQMGPGGALLISCGCHNKSLVSLDPQLHVTPVSASIFTRPRSLYVSVCSLAV